MEEEKVILTSEQKKIRNLKVAVATLTAVAGVCQLVPTPVTEGIAIAAGLGSVLCGFAASCLSADNFNQEPALVM